MQPLSDDVSLQPPFQRRRIDKEMPSSPLLEIPVSPRTPQQDHGMFDTSMNSRTGLLNTSEVEPQSSPLNYGTPSSRMGSVRGTP